MKADKKIPLINANLVFNICTKTLLDSVRFMTKASNSTDHSVQPERFMPEEYEWLSCAQLEYGTLHFSYDNSLKVCCRRDFKDMPEIMKYENEPVNIGRVIKKIDELRKGNNTTAIETQCEGCGYLSFQQWSKKPKPYVINHGIVLNHYTFCNQKCSYCDIYTSEKPIDIMPILHDLFNSKYVNPSAVIVIGGGEPVLLKAQLEAIIELAKSNGNPVAISTNSSVYSDRIYRLLKENTDSRDAVTTSLDAGTCEMYKVKHGRDQFEKVIKILTKYNEATTEGGAKLVVKYIFDEDNCSNSECHSFVEIIKKIGAKHVFLHVERSKMKSLDDKYKKARLNMKEALLKSIPQLNVQLND